MRRSPRKQRLRPGGKGRVVVIFKTGRSGGRREAEQWSPRVGREDKRYTDAARSDPVPVPVAPSSSRSRAESSTWEGQVLFASPRQVRKGSAWDPVVHWLLFTGPLTTPKGDRGRKFCGRRTPFLGRLRIRGCVIRRRVCSSQSGARIGKAEPDADSCLTVLDSRVLL